MIAPGLWENLKVIAKNWRTTSQRWKKCRDEDPFGVDVPKLLDELRRVEGYLANYMTPAVFVDLITELEKPRMTFSPYSPTQPLGFYWVCIPADDGHRCGIVELTPRRKILSMGREGYDDPLEHPDWLWAGPLSATDIGFRKERA